MPYIPTPEKLQAPIVGQKYRHIKEGYFVTILASSQYGATEFRRSKLTGNYRKDALRRKQTHYFLGEFEPYLRDEPTK